MFRIIEDKTDEKWLFGLFQVLLIVIIMFILALSSHSKPVSSPKVNGSSYDFNSNHTRTYNFERPSNF
jgi:hypothetical protein